MKKDKWYASSNPEFYDVGPCESKQEAIEEFKSENEGQDPDHIGIAYEFVLSICGDAILDKLRDQICDNCYEDAVDGWCDFKHNDPKVIDLSDRLTKILHEWLDEVGEKKSFDNITEVNQ